MNKEIMKQEDHYDWLKDEVHCLYERNSELKHRIDKAIEILEEYVHDGDIVRIGGIENYVLDVLKGSDNNDNR